MPPAVGFIRRAINHEPALALSGLIAVLAMAAPFAVVPLRRKMGLDTNHWDADPKTQVALFDLNEGVPTEKLHRFDDAERLAAWSQHDAYRCVRRLRPGLRPLLATSIPSGARTHCD